MAPCVLSLPWDRWHHSLILLLLYIVSFLCPFSTSPPHPLPFPVLPAFCSSSPVSSLCSVFFYSTSSNFLFNFLPSCSFNFPPLISIYWLIRSLLHLSTFLLYYCLCLRSCGFYFSSAKFSFPPLGIDTFPSFPVPPRVCVILSQPFLFWSTPNFFEEVHTRYTKFWNAWTRD